MNELSLFTGAGGGVLGTHHLLGWKTCGYVEWNEYCQRVIAARIADGYLTSAPIFTDVREFVQSGAAEQYRGVADVVSAGFPCQPFSFAGSRAGDSDERDMWPETIACIRIVRPKFVLLENVPGLLTGYLGRALATHTSGTGFGLLPTPTVQQGRNRTSGRSKTDSKHHDGVTLMDWLWLNVGQVKQKPCFVEWMMDWPIGWTDLQPLGTGRFQSWLHAHGRS